MLTKILMEVPAQLLEAVKLGRAFVDGAVVKDAGTNKVLAHLQASRGLATALQGFGGGPASLVMQAGKLVSSVAGNVQLEQVKSMLSTLQVVAGVGAAASVLNLGVSVGGFALVLHRMKQLDQHVQKLEDKIDALHAAVNRTRHAAMITALQRCETATTFTAEEQKRIWLEEERELHQYLVYVFLSLFGDDLDAAIAKDRSETNWGKHGLDATEMAYALAWPLTCFQARLEALLLARQPEAAAAVCRQVERWMERLNVDQHQYVKERNRANVLGPKQQELALQEARQLQDLLKHCKVEARDRRALCETIVARGIDSRAYVEEVRGTEEPQVLMLQTADFEAQ